MTEADQATRGSATKLAADVGGRLIGFATTIVIARALSADEFGRFEVAAATAVIAAEAADLGITAGAARDLVARRVRLSSLLEAKLYLALPMMAAVAVLWGLPSIGGVSSAVLLPLLLFFAASGWLDLLGVVLRARGRRGMEAVTTLVFRAGVLAAVAWAVTRRADLAGLAWRQLGATVPALVLAALLVARLRGPADAPRVAPAPLLRAALPLGVNALLALLSLRVEIFALARWGGGDDVGIYAVGQKLVSFLSMVPAAICAGAMPALVREATGGTPGARGRTAFTLGGLAVPAAFGLWLVPEVVAVFGRSFVPAAGLLPLLAPGVVAVFLNALLHHALIARGKGVLVARLTGVRVLVAAAIAVVLVPRAGIHGAAAGFTAAEWAMLFLARRACAAEGFAVPLGRPVVAGLGLALPMAAVLAALDRHPVVEVAAGAATVAAVALGALAFRRVRAPRP